MADTTRRALLGTAAALAVSGTIPATAAPVLAAHPDAALLAAWDRFAAGWRTCEALNAADRMDDDDPDQIAAYEQIDAADDVLLTAPWHTPAGLVVKLRRMVMGAEPSMPVYLALIHGRPIPEAEMAAMGGRVDQLAARMLQHAETLAAMEGMTHA